MTQQHQFKRGVGIGGADDELSECTMEALRAYGMLPFTDMRRSTGARVHLRVYENQKYRPMVGEWGSARGVHLFPAIDRAPYSDDFGKHRLE